MKRVAMSALVLRKSALSLVLATLPFIFLLTLSVSQQIVALS
ncbi:TPA: hypothetical protein ACM5LU_002259 [Escherichia coli]